MNDHLALPSQAARPDPGRAERILYPENPRYRRIRFLSVLMDQSIVLPTGFRIGLDPILGLVPGLGDAVSALISCYLVYESARLGLPKRVLGLMLANIALDSAAGSLPVIGDIFDAGWKSNMRNLALLERHYYPALPGRSAWRIAGWFLAVAGAMLVLVGSVFFLAAKILMLLAAGIAALFGA